MTVNSQSGTEVLEALRALGGEARTRQIAAALPQPASTSATAARLGVLERAGRVTSSLTLDRLERIWTINGGKR